jgi:hypothetical protein
MKANIMINKKPLFYLLGLATLGMVSSCQAGNGFVTTTEKMTCGKTQFVIASSCKKSTKAMKLNECKPQTLTVAGSRVVDLPELSKDDGDKIKKSGGDVKDLFVTQWGCAHSQGNDFAVLYYSTGGGSAPYSEAWAKYDSTGKLVGKEHTLDAKTLQALEDTMKDVHSIMPE